MDERNRVFHNKERCTLPKRASGKRNERQDSNFQIVLPFKLRPLVLKEMHDEPTAGHLAYQRTNLRVRNNYYWPNMRAEIKKQCKCCEVCLANSSSKLRAYSFPHDIATAPFQVIGIDFLGPIQPTSSRGNRYVMAMTDYFSKWVEAAALPDLTATTTADCLLKHIIYRHGQTQAII